MEVDETGRVQLKLHCGELTAVYLSVRFLGIAPCIHGVERAQVD